MIEIKNIQGNVIHSVIINNGAKRKLQLMKEDYITLPFSIDKPLEFGIGTHAEFNGELFEVIDIQKPTYNNSTGGYDYNLRLDAYYWKWKNKIFKFTPEVGGQEASWSLTASLDVHLSIFLRNLKAIGYTYRGSEFTFSIDSTVENKAVAMSYDNINMIDALSAMAESWQCEWWITDNTINFGRCEYGNPINFEIGVNVAEMTASASQSSYATRLYVFGSDKNLPANYRTVDESLVVNGIVQRRLMLPKDTPCIDAYEGMSQEEAIEEVVILEDIYPKFEGDISSVVTYDDTSENEDDTLTTETFYRFTDKGFNFSKEYILEGQELKVKFNSGSLNGLEFGIAFNPNGEPEKLEDGSWNPNAQLYEIVANEDYGRKLPDNVLYPKEGDKYILIGWDSTKIADLGLVSKAENELLAEGRKILAKRMVDPNTYNCKMFSDYMLGNVFFELGDRVNLINEAFFKEGRESRIIGIEYNLDFPYDNPIFTIGETATYSRLGEIEGKLDAITFKGQTYTGGSGDSIYVIGTNDTTRPTNKNVFSALRTERDYLSKQKNDKTPYSLEVGKDLIVDESIHSKVFSSGIVGGQGWAIRLKEWVNASGAKETKSIAEFDELVVRGLLRVSEFIISQLLGENDNRIYTGMMEVDHYDASDGKVYLKTNGGKLYNTFRVDDIILVQQYGGMPSDDNNHYITKQYEFVVSEVGLGNIEDGEDRLDWVKFRNFSTPMEGGDESLIKEGDTLVRFDNLTDQTRKGIIQMMSVGEDAPYMDFIYGAKTDTENSLKARLGNISGVYNPLFGWLREFGAYISNLYAVGEFKIAHTGEDVSDALEIAKGLFRTNYKQSTYDVSEESNFFTNASFINNCEYWILKEDETTFFWSGDAPQFFNNEPYVSEDSFAGISEYDGRDMLRLMNATIKQENALIRKPSEHKEYSSLDEEYAKVGMDVIDTIYLGLRIYVVSGGTIEYGFVDENEAFIQNSFHVLKSLEAREEAYIESASGIWDSEGDFMIKCSGDMYIDVLSLIDKPLENLKITTSTSIEQDAKSIKLIGTKVNEVDGSITTVKQEVNAQSGTISSLVTTKVGKTEIISSINQSAEAVTIDANKINLNGVVTFSMLNSDMQNTINAKANASSLGSLAYQSSVSKAMLDSTIISGGYINTSLIDVNTLVAKKVITNGDTHGVITYMHDGEIGMKTSSSVQLLRIYSNGSSSHIGLKDNSSNTILLNPVSSSFSFSNGKYLSINTTNGIEFDGGMGIKRFAISSIMTSLSADGDFCIIGGNYTMPNASYLTGRVMWVYATREVTLNGSFMNSNGSSASSISCHGMNFFISNGSSWYRGYCQ